MSGHSKWSSIKHKKAKEDAKRGKMFSKLSRAITVAAKDGGGDPSMNHTLAAAIEKAKDFNMPQDNIERAIKRGTGEIEGAAFEQITYEGYGPKGIAVMVDVLTDNRNRAAADMKNIFSRFNGSLGGSGSVSWMFERKGLILVNKDSGIDEEELLEIAIEVGAQDLNTDEDQFEILTLPEDLMKVREGLKEKEVRFESAEITQLPKNTTQLDIEDAKKILKLIDALEEYDDVQEVYSNFNITSEIMEKLSSG